MIAQALKAAGLRVTGHRLALLGTLATARGPKTVEEIHNRMESADLVTVYRNLQNLLKVGLVREVRFKDAAIRYELSAEGDHHHHVVCRSCGLIDELEDCSPYDLESEALKTATRFASIDEHTLEFFGTCQACAGK